MANIPQAVARFLESDRIAVVGVSREPRDFSRAVFRKLQNAGREVIPVNPEATEIEGAPCYPDVTSVPAPVHGAMIVTPPSVTVDVVRACDEAGISRVWLHRSFGPGSVSDQAVDECSARGMECIAGGCPLMFCEPVDLAHRCMRWWYGRRGRVPR